MEPRRSLPHLGLPKPSAYLIRLAQTTQSIRTSPVLVDHAGLIATQFTRSISKPDFYGDKARTLEHFVRVLSEASQGLRGTRFYRYAAAEVDELNRWSLSASSSGTIDYLHALLEARALRAAGVIANTVTEVGVSVPLNVELAYQEYFRPQLEKAAKTRRNIGIVVGATLLFGMGVWVGHLTKES